MDREVVIRGVTKKQMKLLDKMWSLDSSDDYQQWKCTLSNKQQREVEVLEEMLLLADIDWLAEEDLSDAQQLLMTFSIGNR